VWKEERWRGEMERYPSWRRGSFSCTPDGTSWACTCRRWQWRHASNARHRYFLSLAWGKSVWRCASRVGSTPSI
jgi:hypothetical protein